MHARLSLTDFSICRSLFLFLLEILLLFVCLCARFMRNVARSLRLLQLYHVIMSVYVVQSSPRRRALLRVRTPRATFLRTGTWRALRSNL